MNPGRMPRAVRHRSHWRGITAILAVALVIRLVFLFAVVPQLDNGVLHKSDSADFDRMAWAIASANTSYSDYGEPLILYYMAAIYRVAGHRPVAVAGSNVVLSVLTCLGVYVLTRRLFGRSAALWAALGFALYPEAIYWSVFPLKEALIAPLVVWSAVCAVKAVRNRSAIGVVGFALLLAGLYFARPPWVVCPIALLLVAMLVWWRGWRRWAIPLAVIGVVLALWLAVPAVRQAVDRSLPSVVWDSVAQESVSIDEATETGIGTLAVHVLAGGVRFWRLIPEGYGVWGRVLAPFVATLYLLFALGTLRSLVWLSRGREVLLLALPLILMTFLFGAVAPFVRYRYPLLVLLLPVVGTGKVFLLICVRRVPRLIRAARTNP